MRQLGRLRGDILAVPIVRGPIVDAMEIHSSRENIGIARQAHSGEEPTVATAPQAHAGRIDIAAALQIFSGGDNVLVFRCAAAGPPRSFAKRAAIADATAIVDGQHDIAAAGEILVHGIGIRVVIHVVPAEQHLPDRPAMHEDQRWFLVARLGVGWKKKLSMNFQAVLSAKSDLLRRDKLVRWKIPGPGFGRDGTRLSIGRDTSEKGATRMRSVRAEIYEGQAVLEQHRAPLDALAFGTLRGVDADHA